MRIHVTAYSIATALTIATAVAAQNPPSLPGQSPRPTSAERPTVRGSEGLVTLEGCLARETDAEERVPNVADKAGIAGDYVLTKAKVIKGTPPASLSGAYDVDDLDPGVLASYVGQRVQIDGWFDDIDRAASPAGRGGKTDDLVEIKGSAIRAVAKDCQ